MEGVAFGWLIRGIHHWGTSLMVIIVFIHMLRVFVTASYKYPREMTWLIGLVFYHNDWNGLYGIFAAVEPACLLGDTVGTQIAGSVPFIGNLFSKPCAADQI